MKCKDDIIIYNNEEKRALDAIAELGLQRKLYYKKRNLGMSAQEAFLHCIKVKEKKEKRPNVNMTQIARENHISLFTLYKGLNAGKEIDSIIFEQTTQNEMNQEFLNKLYEQGMPKQYSSLYDFCIKNGLNFNKIYNQVLSGESLYEAVSQYLSSPIFEKKPKYKWFDISLNSLCLNHRLDYNEVLKAIKECGDYKQAIFRNVFNQAFSKNLGRGVTSLLQIYNQYFLTEDYTTLKSLVPDFVITSFFEIRDRYQKISCFMDYYAFLSYLNIANLQEMTLDDRVQYILLKKDFISFSFTLGELYYILDFENGLMNQFSYEDGIWVYNPNVNVLKQIKKPSN